MLLRHCPYILFITSISLLIACSNIEVEPEPDKADTDPSRHTKQSTPAQDSNQQISSTAPDFALSDISGSLVKLDDLLIQNQFVVLVFYRGHF